MSDLCQDRTHKQHTGWNKTTFYFWQEYRGSGSPIVRYWTGSQVYWGISISSGQKQAGFKNRKWTERRDAFREGRVRGGAGRQLWKISKEPRSSRVEGPTAWCSWRGTLMWPLLREYKHCNDAFENRHTHTLQTCAGASPILGCPLQSNPAVMSSMWNIDADDIS